MKWAERGESSALTAENSEEEEEEEEGENMMLWKRIWWFKKTFFSKQIMNDKLNTISWFQYGKKAAFVIYFEGQHFHLPQLQNFKIIDFFGYSPSSHLNRFKINSSEWFRVHEHILSEARLLLKYLSFFRLSSCWYLVVNCTTA